MKRILLMIIFLAFVSGAQGYDKIVHPIININAANQTLNFSSFLKNVGFTGLQDRVYGKSIRQLLEDGGKNEDFPLHRSVNHFHDPLKPWSSAGLQSIFGHGICSPVWAQDQSGSGILAGGDWSWLRARASLYSGLTGANEADREKKLAEVFSTLGRIMHLVSDAAVPAHSRNDSHLFGDAYENWAEAETARLNYSAVKPDMSIFTKAINNETAPVPVSALWDQDSYLGSNPSATLSGFAGLSEFTNANFFSEGTIFQDYPHPAKENTTAGIVEQKAKDGATDRVYYIAGYTTERLAAYSYVNRYLNIYDWVYNLDSFVYRDYANRLIPRAVGYSAALLDYFFRGDMELEPNPGSDNSYSIMNNTDEAMSGTFQLLYDNLSDERKGLWSGALSIAPKAKAGGLTFTRPSDAKKPGVCILVFRGRMGQEQDAVVGREVSLLPPVGMYYATTQGYVHASSTTLIPDRLPSLISVDHKYTNDSSNSIGEYVTMEYTSGYMPYPDADSEGRLPCYPYLFRRWYGRTMTWQIRDAASSLILDSGSYYDEYQELGPPGYPGDYTRRIAHGTLPYGDGIGTGFRGKGIMKDASNYVSANGIVRIDGDLIDGHGVNSGQYTRTGEFKVYHDGRVDRIGGMSMTYAPPAAPVYSGNIYSPMKCEMYKEDGSVKVLVLLTSAYGAEPTDRNALCLVSTSIGGSILSKQWGPYRWNGSGYGFDVTSAEGNTYSATGLVSGTAQ